MSLVTRCPKCQSGFAVTPDQLRQHDGLVRCGQCNHVFDGYEGLQAKLPTLTQQVDVDTSPDPDPQEPAQPAMPAAPQAPTISTESEHAERTQRVYERPWLVPTSQRPQPEIEPEEPTPAPTPASDSIVAAVSEDEPFIGVQATADPREPVLRVDEEVSVHRDADGVRVMGEARSRGEDPSAIGRSDPDFLDEDEPWHWGAWLFWTVLSILLVFLLIVQILVYFRNDLVTSYPQTRPLLTFLCEPVGCEVEYVRRIDRIVIIGSSLRQSSSSSSEDGRNMVLGLTLQNRNAHPQPWPNLLLSLSDASGTVIAKKVLPPDVYLPEREQQGPFGAHEEIALEIDLDVSGVEVSGFEVQKFFP